MVGVSRHTEPENTTSDSPTAGVGAGEDPFAASTRRYVSRGERRFRTGAVESDGWEGGDAEVPVNVEAGADFGPFALPGVEPAAHKPEEDGKAPGEFMGRGRVRSGERRSRRGGRNTTSNRGRGVSSFDAAQPPPEAPERAWERDSHGDGGREKSPPSVVKIKGERLPSDMSEVVAWLEQFTDEELDRISAGIAQLRHDRAVQAGDLESRVEEAHRICFNTKDRLGTMPWCEGNVLWAPGSRQDISTTRHRCRFVRVNGRWVWEWGDVLADDIRRQGDGKRLRQTSITVAVVEEGCEVDVVTATFSAGRHNTQRVDSFVVRGGELERVGSRTVGEINHR